MREGELRGLREGAQNEDARMGAHDEGRAHDEGERLRVPHPRRSPRVRAVMCCTLLALVGWLLGAAPAWSARGHELTGALGTLCLAQPCPAGQLKGPSAVAVNEENGDVYVLDEGNSRVQRFSSAGVYEGQFDGSGKFEVASDPEPEKEGTIAGHAGNPGEKETGQFSFFGEAQISGIAIDNSCPLQDLSGLQCTDPSNGDVYVIDSGHEVIDKFNPRGEYLSQITEASPSEVLVQPSGVAADKHGAVWAIQKDHETAKGILEQFANGEGNAFEGPLELEGPRSAGFLSPGLAVDGEGAFYRISNASSELEELFLADKLDHEGHVENEEFGTESVSGLAAEQLRSNAFIDNAASIGAFGPRGEGLERLPVPGEHGVGLAADAGAETLYAVDKEAGRVDIYTPQPPGAPTIEGESVSEVSADSASFSGEANPRGSASSYRFEYGPCQTPTTCAQSPYPQSVPVPDGPLGQDEDFEVHTVENHVQGLVAATSYHFRLSVRNQAGGQPNETHGKEGTFITQDVGSGLTLPDGRHWELVSPAEKFGALITPIAETGVVQAAGSGDGITYLANAPIEAHPQGNTSGAQILSTRSAGAWRTENLTVPHNGVTGASVGPGNEYRQFSEELELSFVQPFGAFAPSISPEASEQTAFRRSDYLNGDPAEPCAPQSMSCFRPLVTGAPGFANVPAGSVFGGLSADGSCVSVICGPEVQDASADGRHAVLSSSVALSQTPISEAELYEWDAQTPPADQLQLISVLPGAGAQPARAPKLGFQNRNTRGALSEDGSRIVFEAQSPAALYMRDSAKSQTLELDQAEGKCEAEGQCESGGGRFQLASADGSRVLFTDVHRLSTDAGQAAGKEDLYECLIISGAGGEDECELTDLTPETGGQSADVLGTLPGASEDAQWVYFVANGVLTSQADSAGEQASAGGCTTGTAPAGATCNLYLRHEGQTRLVAVLSSGDLHDWFQELYGMPARVSGSGQRLAFMSERNLAGYDNRDARTGQPDAEVYVYGADSEKLSCASCLPSGARPTGIEYHKLEPGSGGLVGGPVTTWPDKALVAANVPGWTGNAEAGHVTRHQPRYLTDEGRLFFNSADGLVSQDVNSTEDVYQYEPPGVGDCSEASAGFSARSGGCVQLISSGESPQESAFLDASQSGGDVFFLTSDALLPSEDHDSARDVYDAHLCSGASPCPPVRPAEPAPCDTGDSCKPAPAPQPEIFGSPASAQFSGPGNLSPPGEVKPKEPTRAERLAKALKSCRSRFAHAKKRRQSCERQARAKYGAKKKAKKAGKAKAKKGAGR